MFEGIPWVLIALLGALVLVIVLAVVLNRTAKASGKSVFSAVHKKFFLFQFSTGIACSLFGAFLMFNGELFGDNTTSIARILGIRDSCKEKGHYTKTNTGFV